MKRLTPHEIDRSVSKQHAYQGVLGMRSLLGPTSRQKVPARYCFLKDHDSSPTLEAFLCSFASWTNSREGKDRADEWRLYYFPDEVQQICKATDLLIVALQIDGSIDIFHAPNGSASERLLVDALGGTDDSLSKCEQEDRKLPVTKREGFQVPISEPVNFYGMEALETLLKVLSEDEEGANWAMDIAGAFENDPDGVASGDAEVIAVAEQLFKKWPQKLGKSQEVVDLILQICDPEQEIGVDAAMERWLEVAEASYWVWEKKVSLDFFAPLRKNSSVSDEQFVDLIDKRWMSFRQSRVSRAGKVMEYFLEFVFRRHGLKFDVNHAAKVDGFKLPDFLFPGGDAYRNESFPVDNLRILGAKTSFKERWTQILDEGSKVKRKHGVTRDSKITLSLFDKMNQKGLTVVMPGPIIERYAYKPSNLIRIDEFIEEISTIQGKG